MRYYSHRLCVPLDDEMALPPLPLRLRPAPKPAMSAQTITAELALIQEKLDKARRCINRRHMSDARCLCLSAESHALNLQHHSGMTASQNNLVQYLFSQARAIYPRKAVVLTPEDHQKIPIRRFR